jgi:5-formyltetrahydrofolate cyclo-ligase
LSLIESREKLNIREKMRTLRQNLSPDEVERKSASIRTILMQLEEVQGSGTVCIYASTGNEVSTEGMVLNLLNTGKRVVVPDWNAWSSKSVIRLIQILDLNELCLDGHIVPQPVIIEDRIVPCHEVDIFLVPGLVFDESGNRLGMGGGYFDRLLANTSSNATLIGLAYDFQLLAHIPTEEHDIPMNVVVTPSMSKVHQIDYIQEGLTR